jgi:hypothetical protein
MPTMRENLQEDLDMGFVPKEALHRTLTRNTSMDIRSIVAKIRRCWSIIWPLAKTLLAAWADCRR